MSSRVLLVRVGAMGDVLHALPAAAALRARFSDIKLDWVVDPRWAPLLIGDDGTGPIVSGLHLAETKQWSRAPFSRRTLRSITTLRRSLRGGHYDVAVDVQGTLRSAVLGRFAAAPRFAGFADPREGAARLLYRQTFARTGTHIVEQNAALLGEALGCSLAPIAAPLPRSATAEAWCDAAFPASTHTRLALLCPSAGWGAKQWPAARFGPLAAQLAAEGFTVLVNAVAPDDLLAKTVIDRSGHTARMAACTLPQLIALTRRAAVVVCGDSGPLHLAAALGVPSVALFGPTDPARNGPWGAGPRAVLRDPRSRTSHKRTAEAEPGLAAIPVDDVLAAVHSVVLPLGTTPTV